MTAHSLGEGLTLFRSKEEGIVFSGKPKHGSVAWSRGGQDWCELIYWDKAPEPTGWVTVGEFRLRNRVKKERNIAFFNSNPHLLRDKIMIARRGHNLLCLRVIKSQEQICPSECSGAQFSGPFGD